MPYVVTVILVWYLGILILRRHWLRRALVKLLLIMFLQRREERISLTSSVALRWVRVAAHITLLTLLAPDLYSVWIGRSRIMHVALGVLFTLHIYDLAARSRMGLLIQALPFSLLNFILLLVLADLEGVIADYQGFVKSLGGEIEPWISVAEGVDQCITSLRRSLSWKALFASSAYSLSMLILYLSSAISVRMTTPYDVTMSVILVALLLSLLAVFGEGKGDGPKASSQAPDLERKKFYVR